MTARDDGAGKRMRSIHRLWADGPHLRNRRLLARSASAHHVAFRYPRRCPGTRALRRSGDDAQLPRPRLPNARIDDFVSIFHKNADDPQNREGNAEDDHACAYTSLVGAALRQLDRRRCQEERQASRGDAGA